MATPFRSWFRLWENVDIRLFLCTVSFLIILVIHPMGPFIVKIFTVVNIKKGMNYFNISCSVFISANSNQLGQLDALIYYNFELCFESYGFSAISLKISIRMCKNFILKKLNSNKRSWRQISVCALQSKYWNIELFV